MLGYTSDGQIENCYNWLRLKNLENPPSCVTTYQPVYWPVSSRPY